MIQYDVVVIGAGAMGSAAAWHLARRGVDVVVFEQFDRGHDRGGSHGSTRIFRLGYTKPDYVSLAGEARDWWRRLESESGTRLLDESGCLDHGPAHVVGPIVDALRGSGIAVEELSAAEAVGRWPGLTYDDAIAFQPHGGRLYADRAVEAMLKLAESAGAQTVFGSRVLDIRVRGDRAVDVVLDSGTVRARHVVVAAGPWVPQLLGSVLQLPRLLTTQEQPAHFQPLDGSVEWPTFLHHGDPHQPADHMYGAYGIYSRAEGVKVGLHGTGTMCSPDARDFHADPRGAEILRRYVREWVPGVDPQSATFVSCVYDTTENEDFVVDRDGPLTIATGFSGHGFKFTPAIGRMLADLVLGERRSPERFSIRNRSRPGHRSRADLDTLVRELSL